MPAPAAPPVKPPTKPVEPERRTAPPPVIPSTPDTPMIPATKPLKPDERECPHPHPDTGLPTCGMGLPSLPKL